MVFDGPGRPLRAAELPVPAPGPGQVLVRVEACGVCRTDLHVIDGELSEPKLPLVLGHQIVGTVTAEAGALRAGQRVGIPWLGWTCGACAYCADGRENLCGAARFTGYQLDGGFAEYAVADARYVFPLPDGYSDLDVAPLLCAGLIGYRALRLAHPALDRGGQAHPALDRGGQAHLALDRGGQAVDGQRLGLYGFGAAAHIVIQVARHQGRRVYAFTRRGDDAAQEFARSLGAFWAGPSDEPPPEPLDAAILFAPAGELVPAALRAVAPGGVVVCGGIHMSDIPSFPYRLLWEERVLRSVANLTRRDAEEFLALAPRVPVRTAVQAFPLEDAGEALRRLREGRLRGAAVVVL